MSHNSRSQDENVPFLLRMQVTKWDIDFESPEGSTKRSHYNTYICWLYVEFIVLKWSVGATSCEGFSVPSGIGKNRPLLK